MRPSRVKKRWAENQPVLATVAHFTDPQSAEMIGLMGFDSLWIDLGRVFGGMAGQKECAGYWTSLHIV